MSNMLPGLPPPPIIPMKERASILFLEKGQLDVLDGAFVLVDQNGVRISIPVAGLGCLMLEPGTRISHNAVVLASHVGTLLIWVGEGGVRLYAAGQPGGARSDKLLFQARLALDDKLRLKVVEKMYECRFNERAPKNRSIEQLRGFEGARVKKMYSRFAQTYGINWEGRKYNPQEWDEANLINRCISAATSALYGITEAAILAAGYAPSIGFLHSGKPQSFVYDIADIIKFETVVPQAFIVTAAVEKNKILDGEHVSNPVSAVRRRCRDQFRKKKILERLIPLIDEVLSAGGIDLPKAPPEALPIAYEDVKGLGDVGHRN